MGNDRCAQKYQGLYGELPSSYDGVDQSPATQQGVTEMHIKRANFRAYVWLHAAQKYLDVIYLMGHG